MNRPGVRIPPYDQREISAHMIAALNTIGVAIDRSRAALIDGDLETVRSYARVIINHASTIGTVGLP